MVEGGFRDGLTFGNIFLFVGPVWFGTVGLWLVLCFMPPIGLIQVTDDHLLVRRWPLARSLNWKELQEVRGFIAERGEPKIVGLRRDGTVTKPVSIMFGSPPHNDWWAEVIRQMDAHGISHPDLDLESGRPYTSLDLNLKTGEIKPVSEGKVRDW